MKPTNTSFTAKSPKRDASPIRGVLAYFGIAAIASAVLAGVYFASLFLFPAGTDERPAPRLNPKTPPGPAPDGMVWVPGGEFYMGVDGNIDSPDDGAPFDLYGDARNVHKVTVDGFWMDATEITNAQFQAFVDATGYKTVAELPPRKEDFPNIDPAKLPKEPFSSVFRKPDFPVRDVYRAHQFHLWFQAEKGVDWKHPDGPKSDIISKTTYPVTQICWDDAVAYCKWAGKRLPTEAEWEFAARGGLDRAEFCWGSKLLPEGKWMCNAWQGDFPNANDETDGYYGLAPVAQYPANGYGLFDMAGNAWEWCSDWYLDSAYHRRDTKNPQGPAGSFDISEPDCTKRVQRGGSYLCADNYCRRYLPGARGKGEPSSAGPHIGFRTVKDAK